MKRTLTTGDAARFQHMAAAFFKADDFVGAERAAFVCTQLAPEDVRGWVLLGAARAKQLYHSEALFAFEQAAKLEPNNVQRWVDMAECHLGRMSYAQAAQVLRRAMELDPNGEHPAGRRARALVGRTLISLRKR